MASKPQKKRVFPLVGGPKSVTRRKAVPHKFVLDSVAEVAPTTRSMFGCLAIYVKDKIVFLLRDRLNDPGANGVWVATAPEHHESLRPEFPNMRPIRIMGKSISGWQLLSVDACDFEESALRACELVVKGDPRIGKVPKSK